MKRFLIIISFVFICVISYNCTTVIGNNENTIKNSNRQELEEGIYEIYTGVGETKVIDVANSNTKNGANIEIYERGNQNNQKFRVKFNNSDGTYIFYALHSNKVLDVFESKKENGTNVCQYEYYNGDGQKWYLEPCGDGYYNIKSKVNGLYLDVTAGKNKNGQNIEVWQGNGAKAQKFQFSKVSEIIGKKSIEDGIYNIYSKVSENRLLEVPNNSINNEVEIKTGVNKNLASQKFQVSYNQDGTYSITLLHTKKALDVKYGSGVNGTPVQQYSRHTGNSQKWIIIENEDKTYSLISKCNNLALDIEGRNSDIGAKVQTYKYHGGISQKFEFKICETEVGSKSIDDGTYRILSNINNKKVWEIREESKLQLQDNTKNRLQQKFDIEYTGNGYYKIKSKSSNQVLTVANENPQIGSDVLKQEDKNLDTQRWILKKYSESVYALVSKCKNLYITEQEGKLLLNSETDLMNQQFILINENIKGGDIIQDGVYQIATKVNNVFDVTGQSNNNGANVLLWNNTRANQQRYHITRIDNTDYYKIIAIHSAKSLDVEGGNTNLGANVIQYDYSQTNNQQWLLKKCDNSYYNIISKESGLCLDITAGKIGTAGANVELWYKNGADAQKFKLIPINIIDKGTYEIETRLDSNKVIDISAANYNDGANAVLWNAGNVNHERFSFEPISTDTYRIIAKHSNKALTANDNNVYQTTYINGNTHQEWKIKEAGNNYYNLICKANGKALDVTGGVAKNGTNIQVYGLHNGNSQKFRFVTGLRKFYEQGSYGKSGLAIAGDGRGTNLRYYKYGKGAKVLFANFSIHGFEDSYNHDGAELTYIAEQFKNYLDNNIDEYIINNWTIYIFPCLNPDGQTHGYTQNGPGRNTLFSAAPGHKGIDMNRNWSVGYKMQAGDRNYNGTAPFQSYEASQLRDFMLNHQGSQNITIDTHGWLNETIGDNELGRYYRNQFGLPAHIASYGSGYLINWARTLRNGRSVLVELPKVSNHSQTVNRNYAGKFINATMQMLREN